MSKPYRMPHGLHEGRTFDEIAEVRDGMDYIRYLAELQPGGAWPDVPKAARKWLGKRPTEEIDLKGKE
jgi:hypothetical protein